MRHLDLFSGIGGFALAARWMGWETVAFCEIEDYPRRVLAKNFPEVPIHDDIHTLDGNAYRGRIQLVTGGFPCQPHSTAGLRRGRDDSRHLWPQFARVIAEARPAWAVIENVPGLRTTAADEVLADLESLDYACWPLLVGAVHAGAPHRRQRVWILAANAAYRDGRRLEERAQRDIEPQAGLATPRRRDLVRLGADAANADPARLEVRRGIGRDAEPQRATAEQGRYQPDWRGWTDAPEPELCRGHDGLSTGMDGDRLNGQTSETGPDQILRAVRRAADTEAIQRPARGHDALPVAEALRRAVHGGGVCQRCAAKERLPPAGSETAWRLLRDMWGSGESTCPSLRRESAEQLAREYPDLVRVLSSHPPPPCSACWRDGSWANDIPPAVSWKSKNRVSTLKALGNAIVPQVAYQIFRAIADAQPALD